MILIALTAGAPLASQLIESDGSVIAASLILPVGVTQDQLRIRVEGQVEYLRGQFERHNWGERMAVDRLMIERCNDTSCTLQPIDQPIYQASAGQVDWDDISDQLDPDGEEADSCVYAGRVDGLHTFRDTNSWCETRFTKEGVVVLNSAMTPISDSGENSRIGYVSVESDHPPVFGEGVTKILGQAEVPVSFADYESPDDTTFTAEVASLFTAPGPFTVEEAYKHRFQSERADSSETATLVREQIEGFQPYPGYPRIGYSMRVRGDEMTGKATAGDKPNQVNLILEPAFWDRGLPTCSEPGYTPGEYCNAGYRGDLAITVTDQRGRVIYDNRISLNPIIDI